MFAFETIYLASASPRRRELLSQIGIRYQLLNVAVDESLQSLELADDYVRRVAIDKALAGSRVASLPLPVLAADTIVVCDEQILLKPVDEADAIKMLTLLSGRCHQVKTAVAVACQGGMNSFIVTTDVTFRPMSPQEILAYWQTGEPADKAGSYAIQGIGAKFVANLNGSYSGVVGLPLMETEQLLHQLSAAY